MRDQITLLPFIFYCTYLQVVTNHLLTESEDFKGKSQTETKPHRTFQVNKLIIVWLFELLLFFFLQARNRPVSIKG